MIIKWIVIAKNISIEYSDMTNFVKCRLADFDDSRSKKPGTFQERYFGVKVHKKFKNNFKNLKNKVGGNLLRNKMVFKIWYLIYKIEKLSLRSVTFRMT
jgi:hypothetical protein